MSAATLGVPIEARRLQLRVAAASLAREASGLPRTLEDVHLDAQVRGARVGALAAQTIALQMAAPHAEASEDLRLHLVPAREIEAMVDGGELIQALHVAPLLKFLLKRRG